MKHALFHVALLCTLAGHHAGGAAFQPPALGDKNVAAPAKPKFVFILADDLGCGDLGCYGQKLIQTPGLDRVAAEGMLRLSTLRNAVSQATVTDITFK